MSAESALLDPTGRLRPTGLSISTSCRFDGHVYTYLLCSYLRFVWHLALLNHPRESLQALEASLLCLVLI
jgi:hypothetical protein